MSELFFGLVLEAGKGQAPEIPEGQVLRVSQLALPANAKGRITLIAVVDKQKITLGTLTAEGRVFHLRTDLVFGGHQDVSFQAVGTGSIHITGYFQPSMEGEDGMPPMSDEGSVFDEEEEDESELSDEDGASVSKTPAKSADLSLQGKKIGTPSSGPFSGKSPVQAPAATPQSVGKPSPKQAPKVVEPDTDDEEEEDDEEFDDEEFDDDSDDLDLDALDEEDDDLDLDDEEEEEDDDDDDEDDEEFEEPPRKSMKSDGRPSAPVGRVSGKSVPASTPNRPSFGGRPSGGRPSARR